MKRLIIYDLDGTLVDTGEDIAAAANHMLRRMSTSPLSYDEIRRLVGRGLHDLVKRCLKTYDAQRIQEGLEMFGAYYGEHLLDHSALYPHALEALNYFKSRLQAVITNKPDPFAHDLLEGLGVTDYFVQIVAVGAGYPRKPDPTAVHSMMEKTGVGPDETLLVGDSVIDVHTGRNAGVLTVILTQGFEDPEELLSAHPDVMVPDFETFLTIATQRGW